MQMDNTANCGNTYFRSVQPNIHASLNLFRMATGGGFSERKSHTTASSSDDFLVKKKENERNRVRIPDSKYIRPT